MRRGGGGPGRSGRCVGRRSRREVGRVVRHCSGSRSVVGVADEGTDNAEAQAQRDDTGEN